MSPTPFSDIFSRFLFKIKTWEFENYTEEDLEQFLAQYLKSAISEFPQCKKLEGNADFTLMTFNVELNDAEIEILSDLIRISHISRSLHTEDLLSQQWGTKDMKIFSQANHMSEIREEVERLEKNVQHRITNYTIREGIKKLQEKER